MLESFGFPDEVHDDVEGLIYLGYLEDSFSFCGHHFTIRTLRGTEELLAGLACKEYQEVIGQDKALTWATIGMALVSVDDKDDFCPPIGRDRKAYALARFQYVTDKWFWPLAIAIWQRYAMLLKRQADAVKEMEDFFEGSLPQFMPYADSLIDKGTLAVQSPEILDLINHVEEEEDSAPS